MGRVFGIKTDKQFVVVKLLHGLCERDGAREVGYVMEGCRRR